MTLPKIVELVTKKEIPAVQRYLIFEVWHRSIFLQHVFSVIMDLWRDAKSG